MLLMERKPSIIIPLSDLAEHCNAVVTDCRFACYLAQVLKGKQVPRKDNSIVSKVKEYMFGW